MADCICQQLYDTGRCVRCSHTDFWFSARSSYRDGRRCTRLRRWSNQVHHRHLARVLHRIAGNNTQHSGLRVSDRRSASRVAVSAGQPLCGRGDGFFSLSEHTDWSMAGGYSHWRNYACDPRSPGIPGGDVRPDTLRNDHNHSHRRRSSDSDPRHADRVKHSATENGAQFADLQCSGWSRTDACTVPPGQQHGHSTRLHSVCGRTAVDHGCRGCSGHPSECLGRSEPSGIHRCRHVHGYRDSDASFERQQRPFGACHHQRQSSELSDTQQEFHLLRLCGRKCVSGRPDRLGDEFG